MWVADAHRDDGKRFVVRTDEKLTAFLEIGSGDCKPAPQTVLNNQSLRSHSLSRAFSPGAMKNFTCWPSVDRFVLFK
jgi:hypothetical protein